MTPADHPLTRRQLIAATGALGLGAGALTLVGCGGETTTSTSGASADAGACVLTPEQTEGPFYAADSMIRRDIAEGRPGVPLELRLRVQDASSCEPIRDATVEVWHTDAAGEYSGIEDDATFMRGGQRSNADGQVTFRTVYPGWYQGRTTHIHVKVHAGGDEVHTGQLYFDDAATAAVVRREPYAARGEPETTNASDGIYGDGGDRSTLALKRGGGGYVGRLALGVRT